MRASSPVRPYPCSSTPLITTIALDTSPAEDSAPDVAYDASLDVYAVVWQRRFSAADHDVLGLVLAGDGSVVQSFLVDTSAADTLSPKIAGIDALDRFLITTLEGTGFPPYLHGRVVDLAGGFSVGAPVQYFHAIDHDVGGDATSVPPYGFCVAGTQTQVGYNYVGWQFLDADGQGGRLLLDHEQR